jgi:hypothetical protein
VTLYRRILAAGAEHGQPDRLMMHPETHYDLANDHEFHFAMIQSGRDPQTFLGTRIRRDLAMPIGAVRLERRCPDCDLSPGLRPVPVSARLDRRTGQCARCGGTKFVPIVTLEAEPCEHDWRDAKAGPARARLFRCAKCGAEEERDVS